MISSGVISVQINLVVILSPYYNHLNNKMAQTMSLQTLGHYTPHPPLLEQFFGSVFMFALPMLPAGRLGAEVRAAEVVWLFDINFPFGIGFLGLTKVSTNNPNVFMTPQTKSVTIESRNQDLVCSTDPSLLI